MQPAYIYDHLLFKLTIRANISRLHDSCLLDIYGESWSLPIIRVPNKMDAIRLIKLFPCEFAYRSGLFSLMLLLCLPYGLDFCIYSARLILHQMVRGGTHRRYHLFRRCIDVAQHICESIPSPCMSPVYPQLTQSSAILIEVSSSGPGCSSSKERNPHTPLCSRVL